MKAMLLAAGYGERMLPITAVVPKPLIPVAGRPLAPQILSRLAAEGIDEAVINLHHLPDALRNAFGDAAGYGLRALYFSVEDKQLLGTGGGLMHAAARLKGSGTILVRNSDFLADIPLREVLASHARSGCPATIVVAPHRPGYTPVAVDDRGRVTSFGGDRGGGHLFTGYHVIEESILDRIPRDVPSDIVREVYFGLAAEGALHAYVYDGFWWEFGEPREYLEGSIRLINLPAEQRARLGDFDPVRKALGAVVALGAGADLTAPGVELAGTVAIGLGVRVGERASLVDSVVMPEAWIGPGSSLHRCIVAPATEIPGGFQAADCMLAADTDPAAALGRNVERGAGILIKRFKLAVA